MFSTVPSKTWHRCRREPSAIDCQQGLASLQERTLCHWCPARPCIAAGENPLPLVPSTASKCCRGEPFLQWFPARPCTAAREKVLSSCMLSCACICACVYIPICSGGGWPIGGVELPLAKRCTSPTSKNLNEASRPMFYGFLKQMRFDAYSLGFNAQCLQRRVPRCDWWRWCLAAAVVAVVAWPAS